MDQEDAKLQELLRGSRATPPLPPRFQEYVWRRIGDAEAPARPAPWLDALVNWVLRPRLAFASVAVLMLVGILLGTRGGAQAARHDAQARYIASVAPGSLR